MTCWPVYLSIVLVLFMVAWSCFTVALLIRILCQNPCCGSKGNQDDPSVQERFEDSKPTRNSLATCRYTTDKTPILTCSFRAFQDLQGEPVPLSPTRSVQSAERRAL